MFASDFEGRGDAAGRQFPGRAVQHQFGFRRLGDRIGGVAGGRRHRAGQVAERVHGRVARRDRGLQGGGADAAPGGGVRLGAAVFARGGPAPVPEVAVEHRAQFRSARIGLALQGVRQADVAIQIGRRPAGRPGIAGRQAQTEAGQPRVAAAAAVLQAAAQGHADLVVQVVLVGPRDRRLGRARQQGAIGVPLAVVARRVDPVRVGAVDIAFGLVQGVAALAVDVQRPAVGPGDLEKVVLACRRRPAALVRPADVDRGGQRAEVGLQHDVHDALVGAVAVGQGRLFRQDVEPLDGLGRNAADFTEAGDATAVDQEDRGPAARAAGLGLQQGHQFADIGGAEGLDLGGVIRDDRFLSAQGHAALGGRHLDVGQDRRHLFLLQRLDIGGAGGRSECEQHERGRSHENRGPECRFQALWA